MWLYDFLFHVFFLLFLTTIAREIRLITKAPTITKILWVALSCHLHIMSINIIQHLKLTFPTLSLILTRCVYVDVSKVFLVYCSCGKTCYLQWSGFRGKLVIISWKLFGFSLWRMLVVTLYYDSDSFYSHVTLALFTITSRGCFVEFCCLSIGLPKI